MTSRLQFAGRVAPQRGWRTGRHVHARLHELIVVLQGALELTAEDGLHLARPGQVLVYPAGRWHAERSTEGVIETCFLVFEADLPWDGPPGVLRDRDGRLATLTRMICEQVSGGAEREGALVHGLFLGVLSELGRLRAGPCPVVLEQVRAAVLDDLAWPWDLRALAGLARLSPFYFARRFRADAGQPPMTWLRRQRVEAALGLLVTTALPLDAVARRVGLGDAYHLSRVVKHLTGRPPSAWRAGR